MSSYQEEETVREGYVVSLEYTLRFDDGELASDSEEDGILEFIQGRAHVFPLIEQAVEGLRLNDELEVVLPPAETYGEYDPEAVEWLPLEALPEDIDLFEGLELELVDEDTGAELEAVVTEVQDDGVVVDLNHPLAGETLTMKLKIVGIRLATDEELAHDHVHGEDFEDDAGSNGRNSALI